MGLPGVNYLELRVASTDRAASKHLGKIQPASPTLSPCARSTTRRSNPDLGEPLGRPVNLQYVASYQKRQSARPRKAPQLETTMQQDIIDHPECVAWALALLTVADACVGRCEIDRLEELDAFRSIGVSRARFLEIAHTCRDEIGENLISLSWLAASGRPGAHRPHPRRGA